MADQVAEAKLLFYQAIELEGDARSSFLAEHCAHDEELRQQVESLLNQHETSGSFMKSPFGERSSLAQQLSAIDIPNDFFDDELSFLQPTDKPERIGLLDEYEIIELIGSGGMGIVLKAFDPHLARVVAIKVLKPMLAINVEARKRFIREARAAAAVSDDHVVTVFAVKDTMPLPYIVMEYIVGRSVKELIDSEGSLETKRILRIGLQIASGLAAAHAQGIIHRDIKPANILLQNGIERVKLTDFGLARAMDDATLTSTGHVAGTPLFMSPEQALAQHIDQRSDLFSLGCVLYSMCTGRPAFRADSTIAILRRVCEDTPRPIRQVNSAVPAWLAKITERLLAKKPEDRFQTASQVADQLGKHLAKLQNREVSGQSQTDLTAVESVGQSDPSSHARGRTWLIGSAFLAVLCLGLVLLSDPWATENADVSGIVDNAAASEPDVDTGAMYETVPVAQDSDAQKNLLPPDQRPVKVFILAGDSNMGGKAKISLLEYQLSQPEMQAQFAHLKQDGKWIVRDDVWIKSDEKFGPLTVGYGHVHDVHFGPELEFGRVVGDYFDEQVLLIKTQCGGGSLFADFRPPSLGRPGDRALEKPFRQMKRHEPKLTMEELNSRFGTLYNAMIRETYDTLDRLDELFPEYQDRGYEIAGFVWFQGWNDQLIDAFRNQYKKNLVSLINDVRRDLGVPELPVVVGQIGVNGVDVVPLSNMAKLKQAQADAAASPEFQGTVALVPTDVFWDTEADAAFRLYAKDKQNQLENWQKVGSDFPFHYLGSAKTFCQIGAAFGEAMIELQPPR